MSNNRLRLPFDGNLTSQNEFYSDPNMNELMFDLNLNFIESQNLFNKAFIYINRLAVVRCQIIDWNSIKQIVHWMPALKYLTIAHNDVCFFKKICFTKYCN